MKSVNVLIASAGLVAAQTITADIAAISSAVGVLNSQVSAFSEFSQASAIVDQSNTIVSLINKGTTDAKAEGAIPVAEAGNLLQPFMNLASAVNGAVGNLVSRKAVATSLTLGNVVEAQLESQLVAAQSFAAVVQSELPAALSSIGASLAGAILSDLSSGSAAFSGLSGPSTLGSAPASVSAVSTSSAAVSSSSAAVSSSSAAVSSSSFYSSSAAAVTGSSPTYSSNGTVAPTSTPSISPSEGGADKAVAGFFGMAAAAFVAMVAL